MYDITKLLDLNPEEGLNGIRVHYWPKGEREENVDHQLTHEGRVTDINWSYGEGGPEVHFVREDEQPMHVEADGELYTTGSYYPYVGSVTEIEVICLDS